MILSAGRRWLFVPVIHRTWKPYVFSVSPKEHRHCHRSRAFTSTPSSTSESDISNDTNERVLIKDLGQGIYNVQLNRPKKCNALDMHMFESIGETISKLQSSNSNSGNDDNYPNNVRCIILSGNGRAFCTGLDVPSIIKPGDGGDNSTVLPHTKIRRLLERPSGYDKREQMEGVGEGGDNDDGINHSNVAIGNLAQDVSYLWRVIPVPVIAVMHGMCYGAGLQIGLGADIRITHETCKLSIMEAKWGLIPDMCASITLRELISIDVAKELTFTGRIIDGVEAKEIGLVTKCIRSGEDNDSHRNDTKNSESIQDELMEEALKLAKVMVQRSPDAIAAAKSLYQRTWIDSKEEQCLDLESKLQKKLLPSWNQFVASSKNFGLKLSYIKQKNLDV